PISKDKNVNVDQAIEFENSGQDHGGILGFTELRVNDVTENKLDNLKDVLRGYEKQNQFLNKEILELHTVVQCLEAREQHLARKNFDIEADYYQLKSRYLLLLNHFKPNKGQLGSKIANRKSFISNDFNFSNAAVLWSFHSNLDCSDLPVNCCNGSVWSAKCRKNSRK
uniref:Uncharacterized protein n=1 Tax=Romanomermis culicivorax TaxID=13658 RepID=A0A915JAU7_ROMCU